MSLGVGARIGFVTLVFLSHGVRAEDYSRDNFRDIRWLGRGNAGLASVSDGTALFYNPAGLARSDSFGIELINPGFGANQNFVGSFSELSTLTSGSQSLSQKFSPFLGRPLGLQGSAFPHLHAPGFAFGFWDYFDASAEYRNPVYPELDLDARNDYGLILGGAWAYKKVFSVGASLRYQKRRHLRENITAGSILASGTSYLTTLMRRGGGYGINVGFQLRQDWDKQFLALGGTIENLGYLTFASSGVAPDRQAQQFNLGTSYGANAGPARIGLHFDVRQLNTKNFDLTKRLHTGVEAGLLMFDVRLGLFQGYWTAGLSAQILPFMTLDFTTYGEELDAAAGQRYNRYWMMGFSIGVDLQPKSGKKKKQRYTLDHL